jgi:hypothetical protein
MVDGRAIGRRGRLTAIYFVRFTDLETYRIGR